LHLTLLCFAALQVPLGVLLTLHFMPRALLEELRARASGVTKTDYKVRVCVFCGAICFDYRLGCHVGPALLLNDCASLDTLGLVTVVTSRDRQCHVAAWWQSLQARRSAVCI
jgi:hypothetical protein